MVITAKFRGKGGRPHVGQVLEPRRASFSWLLLACVSREGLQRGLQTWSWSQNDRLAGLCLEQVLELLLEPFQTEPYSLASTRRVWQTYGKDDVN